MLAAGDGIELDSVIRDLDARARSPSATPFDLADLADALLRRAQRTGDDRDYQASEDSARRSLALLASPSSATLTLAKLAAARHQFRESIALAQTLVPGARGAAPFVVLASAHLAMGDLDEATRAAERAVSQTASTSTHLMRALVMQAQGRDTEAAFDFSRAVAVEDFGDLREAVRTRALWGRFLMERGQMAGARRVLDEASRIAATDPLALAQQAEMALRERRPAEAHDLFRRAFLAARQSRYLIDLARAEDMKGNAAAADALRAQVERMLRADLRQHGRGHQLELVEVLVDRGQPIDLTEAVALARDEVERRPSAETRFQLARALARVGARAEALVEVRAALAAGTRSARLFELASRLEPGPRAALYADQAAQLDPGASGWRALGMPTPPSS